MWHAVAAAGQRFCAHNITGLGICSVAVGNGEFCFDPAVGGTHPSVAPDERKGPNEVLCHPVEASHHASLVGTVDEFGKSRKHPIAGRRRR